MKQSIFLLFIGISLVSCVERAEQDTHRYMSNLQGIIDYEPEMVGPGIISKASFEGHATITPDGKEIYFAVYSNDHGYSTIAYSKQVNGVWTEPEIVEFSGKYRDGSPALTPDGSRLYFSSNRPMEGSKINESNDIWYVDRNSSDGWSKPVRLNNGMNQYPLQ